MQHNSLSKIRAEMKNLGLEALIIPSTDPHKSEYITDYWKCREWLTGFTGSAGTAIITNEHAGLWTDSRYFIQAEKELIKPFELHKQLTKQPEYIEWLVQNLSYDQTLGYNGSLFSVSEVNFIESKLSVKQIKLVDIGDIFDEIWMDRPAQPTNTIIEHDIKYAGKTRIEKLNALYEQIKGIGATNLLISKLDDIAWLLNIRGSDIQYNPVVSSYFMIKDKQFHFFIDKNKITDDLYQTLSNDKITIHAYMDINIELESIKNYSQIIIEKNALNNSLYNCIPTECETINVPDLIAQIKTIKNNTEIENYKKAQLRDGIAVCEFLQWLEDNYNVEDITELSAAEKLESFRSAKENFMGLSFGSISAFGANAALPHYSATSESDTILADNNLYLIDSGGQYLDGTTDITRTICLGQPSPQQIEDFTLVLKGHIKLASAIFPKGTKGYQLDTLTREALWTKEKNYGHGAGHGIGFFLNVHEGPQGFSPEANGPAGKPLAPGMLTTNEPGFYLEGEYGIRIENILLCTNYSTNNIGEFLKFKTISYCPIDTDLINIDLLTQEELNWLNNYHKETYEKLEPFADSELKKWLKIKTKSI